MQTRGIAPFVVAAALAGAWQARCGETAASFAGGLAQAFRSPSPESRPDTYFFMIGGNVAKAGMTVDLEAIKEAGIGGINLFHGQFGGPWPGVSPQIPCLSPEWDDVIGHAAKECARLGLRLSMQNCPGWALSGGPWIKHENAMRHLSWSHHFADGGGRMEATLPRPPGLDYRDVSVLAFPAVEGDWMRPLEPASVKWSLKDDPKAWCRGKRQVQVPGGVDVRIEFEFAHPVTVRTLELPSINSMGHHWCYDPATRVTLEMGGKKLVDRRLPAANWQDDRPVSFACDETTARSATVVLRGDHAFKLGRICFFSSARNDDWEAQAGWTLRNLMRNPPARQSEKAWVKSAAVRDVTAMMKPDGSFSWNAPPGRWTIVRAGHVNTGQRNGPAPREGTGYECDKLSAKAADLQFDSFLGRLFGRGGAARGKLDTLHVDSWECKRQTWTEGLDGVFAARMGYDLLPWLPAVFGYVVDSPRETEKFLNDWRGLIADLICENFYARTAKRARENGMTISFETSFGDAIPGDVMKYFKHADTPMCEFWQPRGPSFVGSFNFKPVKPCVSAAHLYGRRSVGAEALTSFELTWDEKLRDLKHVANLHLAEEVTHMVLHTYTHNPRTDWLPPGTSFGAKIGTPFLRGQTWWKFMPHFTAYLARCQTMLEAGRTVRDVLWYLGDEWDNRPDHDAPFPEGHRYDYCNPDALLTRLSAGKDGMWTTPDGTAYRVLWLPDCRKMLPETMEKILAGLRGGAVAVMASLPHDVATLRGGAGSRARFEKARAELAGGNVGSGRLYVGTSIGDVLKAEKVAPDFQGAGLAWNHRRADGTDWYFVAPSAQGRGFAGVASFRAQAPAVEIWHPETGGSEPAEVVSAEGGRTGVSLRLAPHEACFVVFRRDAGKAARVRGGRAAASGPGRPIGPWRVRFPDGWGMPGEMPLAELRPWKALGGTPEARAFSGTAEYCAEFVLDEEAGGGAVTIDLGRVESLAEVEVNGRMMGALWSYPYAIDVTAAARKGVNSLKVRVTDTWFNRLVYDAGLPEGERRTWTIAGPRRDAPLRDSGLLGPVSLRKTAPQDALAFSGSTWYHIRPR